MIYILSFIKIGSGIRKLMGGGDYRHTQEGDLITLLLLFLQNKESRLKGTKICVFLLYMFNPGHNVTITHQNLE
jgi:hypothetical protein